MYVQFVKSPYLVVLINYMVPEVAESFRNTFGQASRNFYFWIRFGESRQLPAHSYRIWFYRGLAYLLQKRRPPQWPGCLACLKFIVAGMYLMHILKVKTRTTDTQWRHKSKKSEILGRCGRQDMLRPYLKIWEWEWIFGRAVKTVSSLGVRSPWY